MKHSFTDIAYTLFLVSDIERAREFYCGKLGLSVALSCYEGNWIELNVGAGTLVITNRREQLGGAPGSNGAVVSFEVEDLCAIIELVEEHGIRWTVGPVDAKFCRGGIVEDPDGNRIMFHERKRKEAQPVARPNASKPPPSSRNRP